MVSERLIRLRFAEARTNEGKTGGLGTIPAFNLRFSVDEMDFFVGGKWPEPIWSPDFLAIIVCRFDEKMVQSWR